MYKDIYELAIAEETSYQTVPVSVTDEWDWSMYEHVKTAVLYKNSKLLTGASDNKPVKNITRPILNLQYRAEGFDVKDIQIYVDEVKNYYKSLLLRKYHDKWARENGLDTFIDDIVESYVDFGGALVKRMKGVRPEVVKLQRVAFCDQTSILSGPIAEKHFYSPEELKGMESFGWKNIDLVITKSSEEKGSALVKGKKSKTPGKYITVYEIHGVFPRKWLEDKDAVTKENENDFVRQLHIICLTKDAKGNKQGTTLYVGKEPHSPYKLLLRDEIYGRALGLGGVEELVEPQVWTNYVQIIKKGLLDMASKMVFQTSDSGFVSRNKITDLENGEILDAKEPILQINTVPINLTAFDNWVSEWQLQAQTMAAAQESIMGASPPSGTPFKLQELVTAEAHSLHEYRKGKIATFIEELYFDWFIPDLAKDVSSGKKFLAELDTDEIQWVADRMIENRVNRENDERVMSGELPMSPEEKELMREKSRIEFAKGGNKRFFEIFKQEFKDVALGVRINIAGKQKNLAQYVDKLVNVFRQIAQSPQILDDPRMAKLFNQILEASGLEQIDFSVKPKQPIAPPQVVAGQSKELLTAHV